MPCRIGRKLKGEAAPCLQFSLGKETILRLMQNSNPPALESSPPPLPPLMLLTFSRVCTKKAEHSK